MIPFYAMPPGLSDVVDLEWLRMFNYHEHQVIISGAQHPVDLDDLQAHTNYSGGYDAAHPVIENFWTVVCGLFSMIASFDVLTHKKI